MYFMTHLFCLELIQRIIELIDIGWALCGSITMVYMV